MPMKRLLLAVMLPATLIPLPAFAQDRYAFDYVGDQVSLTAKHEDTFVEIARNYNLGYVEMRAANPGVDPWLPGKGTEIIVPAMHILPDAPHEGIVINLPEMRLFAFPPDGSAPVPYAIGIGREGLDTPLGTTTIVNKIVGPEWRPTKRMREEDPTLPAVVPSGPENPLGTHALYLGWPEYRIHGTNKPYGIGRRVSSGCIRMYPEGILDLYDKVDVGMPVTVVDQPVKVGWRDDTLYLEAHPATEQADQVEVHGEPTTYRLGEQDMKRILRAAGHYANALDWPTIRKVIRERRGYPVPIARKPQTITEAPGSGDPA